MGLIMNLQGCYEMFLIMFVCRPGCISRVSTRKHWLYYYICKFYKLEPSDQTQIRI